MNRKKRAAYIQECLRQLFPNPSGFLVHETPYQLLVSVVLSARCTDKQVNLITPKLFAMADTPEKMAQLSPEIIQPIIRPCGLSPAKAKAIHGLSRMLCEKYGGEIPNSFEALEALPGVGHKTASVVLSQAFGMATFPVDTHIHRLAMRWGLTQGRTVQRTEKDLKALYPPEDWRDLHLQLIAYGRLYCPARGCPIKAPCPICLKLLHGSE